MIALQDTNEHLRRRRPWTRAFHLSALEDYTEFLAERTEELITVLKTQQQHPVMLDQWLKCFSCVGPTLKHTRWGTYVLSSKLMRRLLQT